VDSSKASSRNVPNEYKCPCHALPLAQAGPVVGLLDVGATLDERLCHSAAICSQAEMSFLSGAPLP